MQYVQDYDETFPEARLVPSYMYWEDVLMPYVKSYMVFSCPDLLPAIQNNPYGWNWGCAYGINLAICPLGDYPAWRPATLASITSPAHTILGTDTLIATNVSGLFFCWLPTDSASPPNLTISDSLWGSSNYIDGRHSEGTDTFFADGHVKWYKVNNLRPAGPEGDMWSIAQ